MSLTLIFGAESTRVTRGRDDIVTCRIKVYKVCDGVLLICKGGRAGRPGPRPRKRAGPAPRAATQSEGVRALPGLLPQPQRVQPRERPEIQ